MISVAMATYNGEKYIGEQIQSILNQELRVDEIVFSDDGSTDDTVSIIRSFINVTDTKIVILSDNKRHGPCGNFEHAINHCSGDYIFLCDQDDIWLPDKTRHVVNIFKEYPWIECVFHDASLIDKKGQFLEGDFTHKKYPLGKLSRDDYLGAAVSAPITNGMVMCISNRLAKKARPFPKSKNFHDQWLMFCALCMDGVYHLQKCLTYYRLHGANYSGNIAYGGNYKDRIKKILDKPKNASSLFYENYYLGISTKRLIEEYKLVYAQ